MKLQSVDVIACIRNNETGEIREYKSYTFLEVDGNYNNFIWEEGNYSCDCNRHLFFKRAKDEETDDDWNRGCSDYEYSVNLKDVKTMKVFYKEY